MKKRVYIMVGLLLGCIGCSGKSDDQMRPRVEKSKASQGGLEEEAKEPSAATRQDASLEKARKLRRVETLKYGSSAHDAVTPVDACFIQEELRVSSLVGVVHDAYDSPDTLLYVAKKASEKALQGAPLDPGCSRREAIYWIRDEDGGGDYAYRIPTEAGSAPSLWWVPDEGKATISSMTEIRPRVYVDRLLNVAATKIDADGELEVAMKLVVRAEELDPSNKRTAEVRGEFLCLVHPPSGVTDLTKFMEDHGGSPSLKSTLAACLMEVQTADALDSADTLIQEVLERNPVQMKALSLRAERLAGQSRFQEAAQAYEEVLKAHPAAFMAHYGAATSWLSLGKNQEALTHLNAYLKVDPTDLDALFVRAGLWVDLGKGPEAEKDYEQLKARAPDAPELATLLARIRGLGKGL